MIRAEQIVKNRLALLVLSLPLQAAAPATEWVEITQDDNSAIYMDLASIRQSPATKARAFPVVQAIIRYSYRKVVGAEPLKERIDLVGVDCKRGAVATLSSREIKLLDDAVGRQASRPDAAASYRASQAGSSGERVYRLLCGLDEMPGRPAISE